MRKLRKRSQKSFARFFDGEDQVSANEDSEDEFKTEEVVEEDEDDDDEVSEVSEHSTATGSDDDIISTKDEIEHAASAESMSRENTMEQWASVNQLLNECLVSMQKTVFIASRKRKSTGGVATQTEENVIVVPVIESEGNKMYKCPLKSCWKKFKSEAAFKYHAKNHKHSLIDFFKDFMLTMGDLIEETLSKVNTKCPTEFLQSGDLLFSLQDSSISLICSPIFFNTDYKTIVSGSAAVEQPNESDITRLVNKCLEISLTTTDPKPVSNRAPGDILEFLDSDGHRQKVLIFPEIEKGRFKCAVPGCDRSFTTQPSVRYHFNNFSHSIYDLISTVLGDETKKKILIDCGSLPSSGDYEGILQQAKGDSDSEVSKIFFYHWPLLEFSYSSTIKFGLDRPEGKHSAGSDNLLKSCKLERSISSKVLSSLDIDGPTPLNDLASYIQKSRVLYPHLAPNDDLLTDLSLEDATLFLPHCQDEEEKTHLIERIALTMKSGHNLDTVNLNILKSKTMDNHVHLMACGGAILCANWMPNVSSGETQYIAAGCDTEHNRYFALNRQYQSNATLQIWAFSPGSVDDTITPGNQGPYLKMLICHNHGPCVSVKWGPRGNRDENSGRLGLLAASFADGTLNIYSIPDMKSPTLCHLKPILSNKLTSGIYSCISWNEYFDHGLLASGDSHGFVSLWNLETMKNGLEEPMKPISLFKVHDFHISSLAWSQTDPFIIMSGGLDGRICLSDIRECRGSTLSRQYDPVMSLAWNHKDYDSYFINFNDNFVKMIMVSDKKGTVVSKHDNTISSISASLFHDFIASASHDGTLRITNVYLGRIRDQSSLMITLYRASYGDDDHLLMDNRRPNEKLKGTHNQLNINGIGSSVQCVQWNPNPQSSTWILSCGRFGVLRVECTQKKYRI